MSHRHLKYDGKSKCFWILKLDGKMTTIDSDSERSWFHVV